MYHDGVPGDTKVTDPRMCALFIDWKTYKKIYIYIYIYIYITFRNRIISLKTNRKCKFLLTT